MKKFNLLFMAGAMLIMSISSCKKDEPTVPNEEELITTLRYTLTPVGGGTPVVLSFVDLDGDGGSAPTITNGTLATNTTYNGTISLLNESVNPAEDITEEVQGEDEEHQVFFQNSLSTVSVAYTDADADGNPVGLTTTLTTTTVGTGTLTVTLRHEPSKSAMGVSAGDITNAGGETDIEVTFDVSVM